MAVPVAGRGPQVVGVYALFIALTTLTVILRVYCRAFIVKKLGLDDWLAVVGWVTFVVFSAFAITGTHHGTGQHAVDIIPPTEIPVGIMYWWLCEPVYVVSNMFIKGSIAVMLLRLTIIRSHRIIIWATIVITELYSGFFFFLFIFQCRPSSYFWTQYTGGSGTCINPTITVNAVYAYSAITCAGDWIFAILPYFLVWKLQMNWRSKTVVAVILSMGAIASTATIIRIPYVHTLTDVADFLYATTDVAIWSCVETGLGISASCLATLRPLFRSLLANTSFGSSQAQRHTGSGMPRAGAGSRANGYARTHSRGASRGLEELNLGIRKTTRVSVDEFRHWDNGTNYAETDQGSAKSETSKTRITSSETTTVDGSVCPWDSTEGKVVGSAWAEGNGRR